MKKITILALRNAGATTITGPMDVFHLAGVLWNYVCDKQVTPYFDVEIVSTDGKPVKCLNRLYIEPHGSINDVQKTDLILISSLLNIDKTLENHSETIPWLRAHYKNGASIASVCTGAFLLAETGLLDGKTATTHWGYVQEFKQRYPQIQLQSEKMITDEGNLLCSGASNACFDLSIYLIEKFCGHEIALQCAKALILDIDRTSQSPYYVFNPQKNHEDELILEAQKWLETSYLSEFRIDDLADRSNITRRTFERRFKIATGNSPLNYLQRVRVEAAKRLLEKGANTFDEITYMVGYSESSSFRKVFKKHTGLAPKAYRDKFRRVLH